MRVKIWQALFIIMAMLVVAAGSFLGGYTLTDEKHQREITDYESRLVDRESQLRWAYDELNKALEARR